MCYVTEASLITKDFIKHRKGIKKMMDTHVKRNIYHRSQQMSGRIGLVCSLGISSMVMDRTNG